MKIKRFLLGTLFAGAALSSWANIPCDGPIKNRTIYNNIQVSKNCSLEKVTVSGNVILEKEASLRLNQVTIKGNLESQNNFNQVTAQSSRFNGNIQLGHGHSVELINNLILGNLQLKDNKAKIQVSKNTIHGNVDCHNNLETPKGDNNQIKGDKVNQCQTL